MFGRRKSMPWIILCFIGLLGLVGCNSPSSDSRECKELVHEKTMELSYAENFRVDYYQGGYKMLTTKPNGNQYLVIPKGKAVPKDLSQKIVVLEEPMENLYLVSSSVMDMFRALGRLDAIAFSGQKAENWHIAEAKEAMERGEIAYAGKYNQPDYEQIVSGDCSLAIENMMISHAPEVVEKLEEFQIPVLIEYSSYESHPLGRVEWVKFFGALLGEERKAEQIFAEQERILKQMDEGKQTGKTVAFFFVTSNGMIQVRTTTDYIPKMISLAGGEYVFQNLTEEGKKRSTMNIQVEQFYAQAKDADYLIYNSSIDGGVKNLEELLEKCEVLRDFKAVREKNVWCTTNNMYQQSLSIGYLLEDLYQMLRGEEKAMHYLFPLE